MCRCNFEDNATPALLKVWDWRVGGPALFYSDVSMVVSNEGGSDSTAASLSAFSLPVDDGTSVQTQRQMVDEAYFRNLTEGALVMS
ncbi:MAG: hypothetical protein HC774_05450 [Sphingomonadales bacterium]|nr:hypothetical protein [Sphingomonadales bacterium]